MMPTLSPISSSEALSLWFQAWDKHHKEGTGTSSGDMLPKTAKHVCHGNNAPRVRKTEGLLTGMKMLMQSKLMQKG
jgi:hypothetical protein